MQTERLNVPFFPSLGEYHRFYGLTDERLKPVRDAGVWIMNPGSPTERRRAPARTMAVIVDGTPELVTLG